MSCQMLKPVPERMESFNKDELSEIKNAAALLPGHWFVDPLIDKQRATKPLVWVHPDPSSNAAAFSLGIIKQHGLLLITGRHHDEFDQDLNDLTSCGSLSAALTTLSTALMILREGKGSVRPE